MSDDIRALYLLPSLKRAGAEAQVVALVNHMPRDRYATTLLTFLEDQSLADDLDEKAVRHLFVPRSGTIDLRLIRQIATIIDEESIDVVHCTMQYCNLLGYIAGRIARRNPRVVGAIHTTKNVDRKNELADRFLYSRILRKNAWTIFVSDKQRKYWLDRFSFLRERSSVVHNGVDCDYWNPVEVSADEKSRMRQSLECADNNRIISCIAGFRPEKGHDILIEAFADLVDRRPETRLILAGDGPMRNSIVERCKALNVMDSVRIPGIIDDIRALLAITDFTVLSSTAVETLSMAMLESMAMGVPMISTRIGGAEEVISDGDNGFLASPGDAEGLAKTFERAMACSSTEVRENARSTVIESFSLQSMVSGTSKILTRVVSDCGTVST